jgi:peptide/nickel transport system substrate-binding protein
MKKFLVLLIAALMLLSVFACTAAPATPLEPEPTKEEVAEEPTTAPEPAATEEPVVVEPEAVIELSDKTFNAAMTATPTSLDEGYSTNAYCRQTSAHMFETLFTFDEGSAVIPQLADTFTVSDDGLVYDVILRQGITFHDGSSFDADDAIASIERYKTNSTYNGALDKVTVEKVGDYEIKFTLETPLALTSLLAFPQRVIMIPKEVAETHMGVELEDSALIGTGPYLLKEWTRDVRIVLERFDGYVLDDRYEGPTGFGGKRIAYYKTINMESVTEAEARIAGLETGEFDFADALPTTSFDRVNDNTDLTVNILKPGKSVVVEFNHAEGFTMDLNFRKALALAIDPNEVMMSVTSGRTEFYRLDPSLYQPEQYYFTEAGSEGIYNSKNLDTVKELLAAANYNGEEIVYLYNKDYANHYAAGISLIAQWQAAGINIVPKLQDWTTQLSIAQSLTGWSINQTTYSPRFDPNQVRSMIRSGTLGAYGFADEQIDQYLDEIGMGGTNEARFAIWEKVQARIWETLPFLKFGDDLSLNGMRGDVQGYVSSYIDRFWLLHE